MSEIRPDDQREMELLAAGCICAVSPAAAEFCPVHHPTALATTVGSSPDDYDPFDDEANDD